MQTGQFTPACLPLLLGSMPGTDHLEAVKNIFSITPEIPLWPQLPANPKETILQQFLPGLPGVIWGENAHSHISISHPQFNAELSLFQKEYQAVMGGRCNQDMSRFILEPETAGGLFSLLNYMDREKPDILAIKGQTIGPVTFCTSLRDEAGKPIFHNKSLRQCAVKLLALKARWQTQQLVRFSTTPILFFDEPMLFGLGKPSFPKIRGWELLEIYSETLDLLAFDNGLTGIHVCADTDWGLVFQTGVNIISFDAYNYFDRLLDFPIQLKQFLEEGGMLAFGIVPTSYEMLLKETSQALADKWDMQVAAIAGLDIDKKRIQQQSFITPSCGTGRLTAQQSIAVMSMTRELSTLIRIKHLGQSLH